MADKKKITRCQSQLRNLLNSPPMFKTKHIWQDWFGRSFILQLQSNHEHFVTHVSPIKEVMHDAASLAGVTNSHKNNDAIKSHFQKATYERIRKSRAYDPVERIRHKQSRWALNKRAIHSHWRGTVWELTPAWQARRTWQNLQTLSTLCTPRVQAAALSTVFNRWTTARRFQQRHCPWNVCVMQCSPTAEDSLEHYCRCPHTRELASRYLRLDADSQVNMHTFNFCNPAVNTQEDLVATALLVYAVYRGTNHLRHEGDATEHQGDGVYGLLRQYVREAVLNHRRSARILNQRWCTNPAATNLPKMQTHHNILAGKRQLVTARAPASTTKRTRRNEPITN